MTEPAAKREPPAPADAAEVATETEEMLREVREGLSGTPRELSSKFFYDRRGSELFEEITRLPEYYLTRAEVEILKGPVKAWIRARAPRSLVELGAGSGRKTRILLEAMRGSGEDAVYVPVDVSADFLEDAARSLSGAFPGLRVEPVVADMTRDLSAVGEVPRPAVFALLGSTIGNFTSDGATELLRRISERMEATDALLLGADLRPRGTKPLEVLEAAYNDAAGVTAEFNRNILRVLNRKLDAGFDPEDFEHRAFYDDERDRIEMHLVARSEDMVRLPDGTEIALEAGESIRTEISCKYDRHAVEEMLSGAGLELAEWYLDGQGRYAVAVATPSAPGS